MLNDPHTEAFQDGKRTGLAIAAIAVSAVAFISLLGIEKAILAVVLAALAWRGAAAKSRTRGLASLAVGIAIIYVITFAVLVTVFHAKLGELLRLLQQLS